MENCPAPPPAARICAGVQDRKSTRLNSSHLVISYAVFCLKKKKKKQEPEDPNTRLTSGLYSPTTHAPRDSPLAIAWGRGFVADSSLTYFFFFFFFFNDTATTEIYTLSLHDALPI